MRYRFGQFEFDPATNALTRSGRAIPLERQPAKTLAALLDHRGQIVSKDELRLAIWGPDHHVEVDRGLAYCLSQIRTALDDSGTNPRFVETLPRKGYRFIAPVERTDAARAAQPNRRPILLATAATLGAAALAILLLPSKPARLAVSIFDNESGDPSLDRWVAGLSDAVLEHLSKIDPAHLSLIGNAAPLRRPRNIRNLKTLLAEVAADFLLLGQLQLDPQGLRFITHLIRLADGVHLKANRIRGSAVDLAAFESSVQSEFERAVRLHVLKQTTK
jgi:DNA-binding winged helix-turn-helix (wHTH) protein